MTVLKIILAYIQIRNSFENRLNIFKKILQYEDTF